MSVGRSRAELPARSRLPRQRRAAVPWTAAAACLRQNPIQVADDHLGAVLRKEQRRVLAHTCLARGRGEPRAPAGVAAAVAAAAAARQSSSISP